MMEYEAFKVEIEKITGINLSYYKEKQMKRRIEALIKKNNHEGFEDYIVTLKARKEFLNEFVNYLTINVSEFYRNPEQWKLLEDEVFPYILSRSKNLKIWSSACSTGDEPYTLVMVLSKLMPLSRIKVLATDIDDEAVRKAKIGRYSKKSLENLPAHFIQAFFYEDENTYVIKDEIKKCVEFKKINLLSDAFPKDLDFIVCRNVMIYFTEDAKELIYHKFNKALKIGGLLFVGSTEQMIIPKRYNFKSYKTFYYEKDVIAQTETASPRHAVLIDKI